MSPRRREVATGPSTEPLVLDAGALIALEREDRGVAVLVKRAAAGGGIRVPAAALAQVWRQGPRHVRLADLLSHPLARVVPLDSATAKAAGSLCGRARTRDVVDASVVVCALEHGGPVLTSDPEDLRRLAPDVRVVDVASLPR